jgi:hypothetical protein
MVGRPSANLLALLKYLCSKTHFDRSPCLCINAHNSLTNGTDNEGQISQISYSMPVLFKSLRRDLTLTSEFSKLIICENSHFWAPGRYDRPGKAPTASVHAPPLHSTRRRRGKASVCFGL